ncbi:cyclic pyranopterin monophosphate synthase MoaC [Heliobacterium chlorum]|uniref:Cyclic pyranopterin monophosphate synthase n=1 Tax=Heliobacterium chlorum TaxID=2698 RepID=A0ABR7T481_HELCL|nr:cyclic pyranopterin monophosphate synthase MoaC [Heliobacterium chlorum]MBC9784780.1 cyclic pyranopterin monophosphate synthase MoaC [Heliobacterium chlorum]
MDPLTHFDDKGCARMVDVSVKEDTVREAVARGRVVMARETFRRVRDGQIAKGDVLAVARLAGIMAAKKTGELIPLCHPLYITGVTVDFTLNELHACIEIESRVKTTGKTGVEMEALTAVSVAALTIYDMCKAMDKEMVITDIRLMEKSGGKSGHYVRGE